MSNCLVYAIVVSLLVVAILFLTLDSCKAENYSMDSACHLRTRAHPIVQTNVINDDVDFKPGCVDFLTRRQCYFRGPDYGQYSYAGCRCSRVGVQMNNGTIGYDDAGLYQQQPKEQNSCQ